MMIEGASAVPRINVVPHDVTPDVPTCRTTACLPAEPSSFGTYVRGDVGPCGWPAPVGAYRHTMH